MVLPASPLSFSMKLIVQNLDGQLFAYMETEKHFRKVEHTRGPRLDGELLANDCELDSVQPRGAHMVFDIQRKTRKNK